MVVKKLSNGCRMVAEWLQKGWRMVGKAMPKGVGGAVLLALWFRHSNKF